MNTSPVFPLVLVLLLGISLGLALGVLWARSRIALPTVDPAAEADQRRRDAEDAVVRHSLERLSSQLQALEGERAQWQGRLHQQVGDMRLTAESLRSETAALTTALRRPQVRGRWGELHLRRAVELAGMVPHCDFTEQARYHDGALRPDVVVHLAGGREVVIDSKVPLEGYLDATSTEDPDEQAAHLARHVRQVRTHVDQLSSKQYWKALEASPEFVVLFVPAESFLGAALSTDETLLEYAAARQVVLATPSTLIALLRTVAHGWRHEALTSQAREIHTLAAQLHERLGTFAGHLDATGKALNQAMTSYNRAVGSLESRVLVSARKVGELGISDDPLPSPRPVENPARQVSASEYLDRLHLERESGPARRHRSSEEAS